MVETNFSFFTQKGGQIAPFCASFFEEFYFFQVAEKIDYCNNLLSMPRKTPRQQVLDSAEKASIAALKNAVLLEMLGASTTEADELLVRAVELKHQVKSRRYLQRGPYRKRKEKFAHFLDVSSDDALTEEEFRFHFRVGRTHFGEIVSLLSSHQAFQRKNSDSRGAPPKPAAHQLLVLFKYYGCEGNQSSSVALGNFFGVGKGVIDACRNNALKAILSLEDNTYIWPDAEERRVISSRIKEQYKFPNCVGIIDGTLLPLAARPLVHGENYLSRKRFYAVVMLVVCDDQGRVLYHHIGWPGSVHDNRVWRNCKLNTRPGDFFSNRQYLLGDSAFTASAIMIPPFKATPGESLSNNKTAFDTLLAKPRVKSEHCIGILKARFPFLRSIRLRLASASDMKRLIDYVRGTVVLHNFLRNDGMDEWLELPLEENQDDLDAEPATASNEPDYQRRDELFFYLSELEDTTIN